jgi:hypothetical protein
LNGVRLDLIRLEHDNFLGQRCRRLKATNQRIVVAVREEYPHTFVGEPSETMDEAKLSTDVVLGFVVDVPGYYEDLRLLGDNQVDQIIEGSRGTFTDLVGNALVELTAQRLEWRPEMKIGGVHHGADPAIFVLSHLRKPPIAAEF